MWNAAGVGGGVRHPHPLLPFVAAVTTIALLASQQHGAHAETCWAMVDRCEQARLALPSAPTLGDSNSFFQDTGTCGDGIINPTTLSRLDDVVPCGEEGSFTCGLLLNGSDCVSYEASQTWSYIDPGDDSTTPVPYDLDCLSEQCDDGNNVDGDGCSSTCQFEGVSYSVDAADIHTDTDEAGYGTFDYHADSVGWNMNTDNFIDAFECLYPSSEDLVNWQQWEPYYEIKNDKVSVGATEDTPYPSDIFVWSTVAETNIEDTLTDVTSPPNFVHSFRPTCCQTRQCGNGLINCGYTDSSATYHPEEQCDDENNDDGDGCAADCTLENGWNCFPKGATNVTDFTKCVQEPNFKTPEREVAFLVEWYNESSRHGRWMNDSGWHKGLQEAFSIERQRCDKLHKNGSLVTCQELCSQVDVHGASFTNMSTVSDLYALVGECNASTYDLISFSYGFVDGESLPLSKPYAVDLISTLAIAITNAMPASQSSLLASTLDIDVVGDWSLNVFDIVNDDDIENVPGSAAGAYNFTVFEFNITTQTPDLAMQVLSYIDDDFLDSAFADLIVNAINVFEGGNLFAINATCNQDPRTPYRTYHKSLCDTCCNDACRNLTQMVSAAGGNAEDIAAYRDNCNFRNGTVSLQNHTYGTPGFSFGRIGNLTVNGGFTNVRVVDYNDVSDPCGYCRGNEQCPKWFGLVCGDCFENAADAGITIHVHDLADTECSSNSTAIHQPPLSCFQIDGVDGGGYWSMRCPDDASGQSVFQCQYSCELVFFGTDSDCNTASEEWNSGLGEVNGGLTGVHQISDPSASTPSDECFSYSVDSGVTTAANFRFACGDERPHASRELTSCDAVFRTFRGVEAAVPQSPIGTVHITELIMPHNNIKGGIVEYRDPVHMYSSQIKSMGDLQRLRRIELNDNSISNLQPLVSNPPSEEVLPLVSKVFLQNNKIRNTNWLDLVNRLASLEEIFLNNNRLSGTISPTAFATAECAASAADPLNVPRDPACVIADKLVYMKLEDNEIYGTLPVSLAYLSNLDNVILRNNSWESLEGYFPSSQLRELNIDKAGIQGMLPPSLFSCAAGCRLLSVRLDNNLMSGTLPEEISQLQTVRTITLSNNLISGTLPDTLGDMPDLMHFNLALNRFSGELPIGIKYMYSLVQLDLSDNGFVSPERHKADADIGVQELFKHMDDCEELNLRNNNFVTIDPTIGEMSSLVRLDVSHNMLRTLPTELAQLTRLLRLSASDNSLESMIDVSMMRDLEVLDLSNNVISGQMPNTFNNPIMKEIYLQNNQFTGSLPPTWALLSSLVRFNAASNVLSTLPADLRSLTSLQYFDLSHNVFDGTIPTEFGLLKLLVDLNIENTPGSASAIGLAGTLPSELGELDHLQIMDVSAHQIGGFIPTELGSLPSLVSIDLSRNRMSGTLPTELLHNPTIVKANFGDNALTGNLPEQVASLRSTYDLNLDGAGSGFGGGFFCPLPGGGDGSVPSSPAVTEQVYCGQCPDDTSAVPTSECHGGESCVTCSRRGVCAGGRNGGVCQCIDGWDGNACENLVCPSNCSFGIVNEFNDGFGSHGSCLNHDILLRCAALGRTSHEPLDEVAVRAYINAYEDPSGAGLAGTLLSDFNVTQDQVHYVRADAWHKVDISCFRETNLSKPVCQQRVGTLFDDATDCFAMRYRLGVCACENGWTGDDCSYKPPPVYVEPVNPWAWQGVGSTFGPCWGAFVVGQVMLVFAGWFAA